MFLNLPQLTDAFHLRDKTESSPKEYTESIFIYIKLKIYFWQIHVTNMRNGISMI